MQANSDITVLIVDDELDNLQNIVDAFHVAGLNYRILNAVNRQSALQIVEKRHPDIIMTGIYKRLLE